jgi:putative peptide zinc metalloprotease protein
MHQVSRTCFRKELIVTFIKNKDSTSTTYLIKDPNTGETFEFGEEEYFLCKSIDGITSPSQIINNFKTNFGLSLSEEDFSQFAAQIAELGLLESSKEKVPLPSSASLRDTQNFTPKASIDITSEEGKTVQSSPIKRTKQNKKEKTYLWSLPNPGSKFALLSSILQPFSLGFKLLFWSLIIGLPTALFTFLNNQKELWHALAYSVKPLPYFTAYIFNVIFANLTAKLAQGAMLSYYGGTVEKFGLVVTFRFLPRFYVDRKAIWRLDRKPQLWTFAVPLLVRLVLFVLGVLTWFWSRGTGNDFGTWSLLLAHAAFVDFLLDGFPLWPVDGYMFLVSYFRLPPGFISRAYLVLEMVIKRRPLPKSLSLKEKLVLLLYGPAALIFWVAMMIVFARGTAAGLSETFPEIFGRATTALLTGILLIVTLRRPVQFLFTRLGEKSTVDLSSTEQRILPRRNFNNPNKNSRFWIKKPVRLLLIVGFGILLCLPYPYRSGGQIQLLPPTQQQIQAQVEGKITKVFFNGGDGQEIKAGTLVAIMEAIDVENNVLTQQEQIKNQQAIVAKEQASLNKLLATPRKEDIEVARQQVEVAKQEVEVAKREVEVAKQEVEVAKKKITTAISKAEFSEREAARFQELYKQGVVSQQAYEDKQKQAETDRLNVDETRQNVAAKQTEVETSRNELVAKQQSVNQRQANLELVLSGPHPDDIQVARKELEAAQAVLKRQQQQLKFDREELQRTQLLMPITGYLVTPYLDQKVGSYLKKGETFAVVEEDQHIRGEVRIAEYNVEEVAVGALAEVKLLAYPNKPFIGKVVSIEPAASTETDSSTRLKEQTSKITDRFVRVIVDIPNTDKILKSSMTGYAKIEGSRQPLVVAFTRPIVRFIQVEVWSWLP